MLEFKLPIEEKRPKTLKKTIAVFCSLIWANLRQLSGKASQ